MQRNKGDSWKKLLLFSLLTLKLSGKYFFPPGETFCGKTQGVLQSFREFPEIYSEGQQKFHDKRKRVPKPTHGIYRPFIGTIIYICNFLLKEGKVSTAS